MKKERKITFTWDIHYKCNFRCPYCWFFKNWDEMSKKNIYLSPDEWMLPWGRIYDKYGSVHIQITGGEPFIYPNFIELIKKLSSIHTIKITTNLSGDINKFVCEIDSSKVELDLNYHPLFIDIDTVTSKTLLLKKHNFKCGICYLAYPPQFDKQKVLNLEKHFKSYNINFALAAFWGEYNDKKYPESYTEEEKEFMKPYLGDFSRIFYHLSGNSPKGKLCNAGYLYAGIHANGDVVRCGPLVNKVIGNVLDEKFSLFDKPQHCEADLCPCDEYKNLVE